MLHYHQGVSTESQASVDLSLRSSFIAFKLELDVFFLESSQLVILIDGSLLFVKGVDHNLDEQVCNEKTSEDHVHDEYVLVDWVLPSLRLQTDSSRVNGIIHKHNPSLCCCHNKQSE